MSDPALPLTDLSPLLDKEIVAPFDGGNVLSDGGLSVVREVERRTMLSARLAACLDGPKNISKPERLTWLLTAPLFQGGHKPDALDPSWCRLLAHMERAVYHAAALTVALCAGRYSAPTIDQARSLHH